MIVIKAITFAAEKHKGQKRRETKLPYITHPLIVSYLLTKYKKSKDLESLIVASILHDTLEDTKTTIQELSNEFSPMIAGLVVELTSDDEQIKLLGKNEYLKIKMVGMSNYALVIKLCDRLSNIIDAPSAKYKKDTEDLLKYLIDKRDLTGTQMNIVNDITVELIKD